MNLINLYEKICAYGLETFSYWSPQLWSLLPESSKEVESLDIFKREVKN